MEIHLQNKEVPHSRFQSGDYSKGTRQALSNYTRLGIVVNHRNTVPAYGLKWFKFQLFKL